MAQGAWLGGGRTVPSMTAQHDSPASMRLDPVAGHLSSRGTFYPPTPRLHLAPLVLTAPQEPGPSTACAPEAACLGIGVPSGFSASSPRSPRLGTTGDSDGASNTSGSPGPATPCRAWGDCAFPGTGKGAHPSSPQPPAPFPFPAFPSTPTGHIPSGRGILTLTNTENRLLQPGARLM